MATLADVARRSGVSVMTASRVLSGRGPASASARDAVTQAADELGYVPNAVARGLRNSRTGTVALVISDIQNSFYSAVAKAAEKGLGAHGLNLTIASSNEDAQRERDILQAIQAMRADALLITPTEHNGDHLQRLAQHGLPIVQLDRSVPGSDIRRVLLDNAGAAWRAVTHLTEHGHRRIALVGGPERITTGAERASGARNAARQAGAELLVAEAASYLHEGTRPAVEEAIDWGPTALIAGNNIVLETCMDVLLERGIDVPTALSLVAFDDLPWLRWTPAPITALRQPIAQMTTAAVSMLFTDPDSDGVERRFPAELVERASVRRITTAS
ncbi:LacI family DNA-binding transcriptional regulator [Gryllotalpicola kribbensis]|uniref:LacI family DNA-binding transcriptional regulator n=1 Tax=Gryllotalpicola kribbensis TaxID=993084 RepID=A0ABP8AW82_9MICO